MHANVLLVGVAIAVEVRVAENALVGHAVAVRVEAGAGGNVARIVPGVAVAVRRWGPPAIVESQRHPRRFGGVPDTRPELVLEAGDVRRALAGGAGFLRVAD